MSGAGFTPGPWFPSQFNSRLSVSHAKGVVASVAISMSSARRDVGLANAALIAAAPDMFEAIQTLLDYVGQLERLIYATDDVGEHAMVAPARAALAKALGATPSSAAAEQAVG